MIAVVGPGAVGGLLAALLHRAGQDVVAVGRPATAARIAAEGLAVRSEKFGEFTAAVPATTRVPAGAAVILAVKTYGLPDVLTDLERARPAEVLALLNGVEHAARLHRLPGRTTAGSVQVEARRDDGVILHRSDFLVVNVPDDAEDLAVVGPLRAAGVTVRTGGTEADVLWRKYGFLAPLALLTTWARAPLGEAMALDPRVTAGVLDEVASIASAEGADASAEAVEKFLRRLDPAMRSSLQNDAEAGGPTELDAIGGALVRLGRAHGVPTPTLERVVGDIAERLGPVHA